MLRLGEAWDRITPYIQISKSGMSQQTCRFFYITTQTPCKKPDPNKHFRGPLCYDANMKCPLGFLVLLLTVLALTACQSDLPLATPRQIQITRPTTIPIRIESHLPIVTVMINGKGPYNMILDTGSPTVVLRPDIAQQLALPKGAIHGSEFARSIGGVDTVIFKRIAKLTLGEVEFKDLDAKLIDIPSDYLGPGVHIDGLLGLRVFSQLLLTIDYPNSQLILTPNQYLGTDSPHVIPARLQKAQHLLVDLPVNGKTMTFTLDTGTSMGFFLLDSDAQKLSFSQGPIISGTSNTPHGLVTIRVGRIHQTLDLANQQIKQPIVYIRPAQYPLISQRNMDPLFADATSLIGGEVLRHFSLTIDQRSQLVSFERNYNKPIEMKGYGKTIFKGLN